MDIFIVEDSSLIRMQLKRMTSELPGVRMVGEAESASDANGFHQCVTAYVVILDIKLKGGTGFDILNNIRKSETGPLVVVLTSCNDEWHRETAMRGGG